VARGVVSDPSSDAETILASKHTGLVDIPTEVSLIDDPSAKFIGPHTDAIMSDETGPEFIPEPESETIMALIKATETNFDIIIPLSTAE
jgi:hypothetical protein